MRITIKKIGIFISVLGILFLGSCKKEEKPPFNPDDGNEEENEQGIDFSKLTDTYYDVADADKYYSWGMHNVHDPVIRKFGEFYYSYSTDVGYGINVRLGLQIRKSKNLVEWTYVGWVFDFLPPKGADYIRSIDATPNNSLWAPSVIEANGEYRLYYSLASDVGLKSCIGLATSNDPVHGWKEVDIVVATDGSSTQTNAIDPSVIITPEGEHWMMYGSSWDGIYILQLDPATGLAINPGDRGKRIAHRAFTGNTINGNIEGPEVIYNEQQGMYYVFIAYDWLSTKYNIRVGRSENVEGPYYDMFGKDLYGHEDNFPMITAPYKFNGHAGWQGVSHCTIFEEDGQYFVSHQGRPGNDFYCMNMMTREIFWTKDGWPVASPERYALQKNSTLEPSGIVGKWEMIDFDYEIVPGFDKEQTSPNFQDSEELVLNENGSINSSETDHWTYEHPWLTLNKEGRSVNVHVSVGRDWEKSIDSTLVFTGNNIDGMPLWGKKLINE